MAKTPALFWRGKNRLSQTARKRNVQDISISAGENDKIHMIARDGIFRLFTDTDFFQFAILKKRLYFTTGTQANGIKLSSCKTVKADNRYSTINRLDDVLDLKPFVGDYELAHDDTRNLYYVERT